MLAQAASMLSKNPHLNLQFALYYLNNELNERINSYQTVWNLDPTQVAPNDTSVNYGHFLFKTLENDGVFYFMCAVLARLTLWGILPTAINPSNPDYETWVKWKDSQTLSYIIGNQMDSFSDNNPSLYDIHKALSIYGNSLNYEVEFMQEMS